MALSPDPPNCVFFMPTTSIVVPTNSLPELVDSSYTRHSNQAKFCSLIGLKLVGQEP